MSTKKFARAKPDPRTIRSSGEVLDRINIMLKEACAWTNTPTSTLDLTADLSDLLEAVLKNAKSRVDQGEGGRKAIQGQLDVANDELRVGAELLRAAGARGSDRKAWVQDAAFALVFRETVREERKSQDHYVLTPWGPRKTRDFDSDRGNGG
jgi:hypothetical protein